jgi:putative ABC transport system ATP-binding protein
MVELFSGLSPDNPLFEQYSFISADELPNVRLLLQRLGGKGADAVPEADRARLMTLPLRYIEARHRLGLIDADMEDRLLAARRAFAANLPEPLARLRSNSTISSATTALPPCRTTFFSAA